jgi:hypothetical protein
VSESHSITRRLVGTAAPLVCAGVLAWAAAPALASGGSGGGGGSTASKPTTTTTAPATPAPASGKGGTTAAGGGAAGGGGTASGGGHNVTEPSPAPAPAPAPPSTTPPVTTPCATFFVYTQPTGYVNGGTAIWHNIDVASCDSLPENLNIEAIDKDPETGQVEYEHYITTPVSGYGNTGATIDNDLIPYSTTYTITYNVYDADSGKLLATANASATTPALQ